MRRTEAEYRELFAEHARSGVTLAAFAASREVPYGTLSGWKTKLKQRDASRADGASQSKFLPVRVVESKVLTGSAPGSTPYEIVLESGRVVRVPVDFECAKVAALVRVLASC